MYIFDKLKEINNEHKRYFNATMGLKYTLYELNGDLYIVNQVQYKSRINYLNELMNVLCRGTNYISNLSLLKKTKVLENFELNDNFYDIKHDIINLQDEKTIDKIIFKRVDNLDSYLSKLVLLGGIVKTHINNIFYLISLKNDIYLLSSCNLVIRDDNMRLANLHCNKLYIDNLNISERQSLTEFFSKGNMFEMQLFNFNVKNVSCFEGMFSYDMNLESLDLNDWNMTNAEDISFMFYSCISLKNLYINNWITPNLNNVCNFIGICSKLKGNFSYLNIDKVDNVPCLNCQGACKDILRGR